jgi:hypothetical protein
VVADRITTARKGNSFQFFWERGYTALLPVIPPEADVRNAGKRPGVLVAGRWQGRAADSFHCTPDLVDIWHEMGASVGISCHASGVLGLDIDVLQKESAERIRDIAFEMLGQTAVRVGRAPKMLLPYRCAVDTRYSRLIFDQGFGIVEQGSPRETRKPGLVEVIAGEGKMFVAAGIHPVTGKPYQWPLGVPDLKDLPFATAEALERFRARLEAELPKATSRLSSGSAGDRRKVDQAGLIGDEKLIAEAMEFVPNVEVDYDRWRDIGIALRGALPDNYALGLELFEAYTERGEVEQPTEDAERVFGSVEPPFGLGASYIFDHAMRAGWSGAGRPVDKWFDAAPPKDEAVYESVFGESAEEAKAQSEIVRLAWTAPLAVNIPRREFLYGAHIVRGFCSATVAPSRTGKSSLATVDILSMVTGRTLLYDKPAKPLNVWYLNGEDPMAELNRRIAAAMIHYGIAAEEIGLRLSVNSGRDTPLVTAVEGKGGVQILRPVFDALRLELRDVDVLLVDPFVTTHRLRENDNTSVDAVMTEWNRLAEAAGVGIEFLHHVRKGDGSGADNTVDSARGASAMMAKVRAARAMTRATKASARLLGEHYHQYFRMTDAQSNLAAWAPDSTQWFRMISVDLGNGVGEESARWSDGDHVGVVVAHHTEEVTRLDTDDQRTAILTVIRGSRWRKDVRSPQWVGIAVAQVMRLDLDDEGDRAQAQKIVKEMINAGVLVLVTEPDERREMRSYVKTAGVFD